MKKFLITCIALLSCLCLCPLCTAAVTFDDAQADTAIADLSELMADWHYSLGTPTTAAKIQADGNNGNVLYMNGYVHMHSTKVLETPYTFETEFRTEQPLGWCFGMFIRGGITMQYLFPYFEVDGYDGANGAMGLGGSGMTIAVETDGIYLRIKNYQEDSRHISTSICKLNYNGTFDSTAYNRLVMEDDGQTITIRLNDQLLATVAMSNPGRYDDGRLELPFTFYKTAVVKDAAGETLLSIDNARLVAEDFCAGIGVRGNTAYFKKIALEKVQEPLPTTVPVDTTPEPEPPVATGDGPVSAAVCCIAVGFAGLLSGMLLRKKRREMTER